MTSSSKQTTLAHSQLDRFNHVHQISNLYTLIPTIVWNKLGPLRRSISAYSLGSQGQATSVVTHRGLGSEEVHVITGDPAPEADVDIRRKYARHGWGLLQTSLSEAQYEDPQSQAFSRQLYISSLSHLLRGLPSDLTDQEVMHLRQALPPSLENPNQAKAIEAHKQTSSILHRGVSTSIILVCLFLRLALPYLRYFLAIAHDYERRHHVTERALALSMDMADSLGKRSMEIAATAMENKLVIGSVQYCIEGICGGLAEGLGEGMKAIESRKDL
ncbi:hypothetical protein N7G274_004831 [Stereocaulon virgatum]|uniref:Uncharacterized protein n=1 Tax=Stereocaulon virgatum TaxID=373712 RepID=A0ABR4A8X4_9LECA